MGTVADCKSDTCNAMFYVFCEDNKETILLKNVNKIVLDNEKVSVENVKLERFEVLPSADLDVNCKSKYFVTNDKNVVVEKVND